VLDTAKHGVKRVVHISSTAVCGIPITAHHGDDKLEGGTVRQARFRPRWSAWCTVPAA